MSKKIDKEFKISSWAIENRMTVYVIIAIVLVGGILSYYSMPRESFPEVVETKIYISSMNPGNSAEDVEKFITEPLEEEFNNVGGVIDISSTTFQDYSMIIVEFDDEVGVDVARQKIKDKVDLVKQRPPGPPWTMGLRWNPMFLISQFLKNSPYLTSISLEILLYSN